MRARCRAGQAAPRARALTLYGSQGSRSPLVSWYLHELGLDFEVAAPNAEGNPHPMGQGTHGRGAHQAGQQRARGCAAWAGWAGTDTPALLLRAGSAGAA